ncbi:phospholipase D-like domain-containing protein [Nocardioides sp.]|uniref:phospholipase D-like domain-containing protein n=1 Tax=Nocardioides sp. TaxID=35761 RepID=UPI0035618FA4
MRRHPAATALATALVLMGGLLAGAPATSASVGAAASAPAVAQVESRPKPAPDDYTPRGGVKFNNPLAAADSRRRIIRHLLRTVNSVPGKEKIRIASWNFRSDELADALIRAHRRGVSVRVLVDRLNSNPDNRNDTFIRMTKAFRGDKNRKPEMRSFTRRCVSSCRYKGGIAHSKFFLFSRAGKATDVVIHGSFNATDLASHSQWNDVFTVRGRTAIYDEFVHVYDQMVKDKAVKQPYLSGTHGKFTSYFYPYKGEGTEKDPLLKELAKVRCQGATGGSGTNGRTKIRIAQTSMHGDRGKAIAGRLRQMWQRGCDVKIVYAVFGNEVLRILRQTNRGPVPLKQIAQDFNLDGVYDRYLHMKNMSLSGVYAGDSAAEVTWNGSANWTSVALASDETVMRIFDPKLRRQYSDWVDWLYANPPAYTAQEQAVVNERRRAAAARGVVIDPYAQMELD